MISYAVKVTPWLLVAKTGSNDDSPSHVGNIFWRHVKHGVWQISLGEITNYEDVVNRVLQQKRAGINY